MFITRRFFQLIGFILTLLDPKHLLNSIFREISKGNLEDIPNIKENLSILESKSSCEFEIKNIFFQ